MNDNDIQKFRKPLSKDHWMAKIQKFSFGIDATRFYSGYCPFFWMTWLALIAAIFVGPFKLLLLPALSLLAKGLDVGGDWLADKVIGPISEKRQEIKVRQITQLKATPLKPTPNKLEWLAEFLEGRTLTTEQIASHKKDNPSFEAPTEIQLIESFLRRNYDDLAGERVKLWLAQNPSWKTKDLPEAKAAMEAERLNAKRIRAENRRRDEEARAKAEKRQATLRKVANNVGFYAQKILRPILIAVACVVLYFIGLGIYFAAPYVYEFFATIPWFSVLTFVGWGAVTIVTLFAVLFGIFLIKEHTEVFEVAEEKIGGAASTVYDKFPIFHWIGAFFGGIFRFIKGIFSFLGQTVKMTYKAECPMIEWGETTESIQKRERAQA